MPCVLSASTIYCEQVGVYLQLLGKSGEIARWYILMRNTMKAMRGLGNEYFAMMQKYRFYFLPKTTNGILNEALILSPFICFPYHVSLYMGKAYPPRRSRSPNRVTPADGAI